ncbi:MAG TPA: PIN domain-containing protein [Terriglobia bacterium]|nr:PIN domain-containing protein [Terriglobia bacterium]
MDTSVFSALYDNRVSDRRRETEEFWERRGQCEIATSELTREELEQTPDPARRAALRQLLDSVVVHPVSDEMRRLAASYVRSGTFTAVTYNDALHVAAAVLTNQDILLSWNFKHLVNRRRRAQINEGNISLGLPTIEIVAPPEM